MSGFESTSAGSGQAMLGVGNATPSSLMELLTADDIVPGAAPSYQICKTIYTYHPLGAKMAEAPIDMAQSQDRELSVPGHPEEDLIDAFQKEWDATGNVGADQIIKNVMTLSRVYGIASILTLADGVPPNEPLPMERLHELELTYNVLDPLNTSGSLTLDQDPNAKTFLKPTQISANGFYYNPSRAAIVLNEQPIYIEWTNSAFGYVGRSVYQRALYPLKTFVQSMITDNLVIEKAGLLVAKLKSPGSIVDQRTRSFFGWKREAIKGAKTGNVLSIGTDEEVASLDLKNLRDACEFARENTIKNIATAAKMPAMLINQETLTQGFGEGSEDAKQIARYIDGVREDMEPIYAFFDNIVQRRAWSPTFYETMQAKYPEQYEGVPYDTAFFAWKNAFKAEWPNLLAEPDSDKAKTDDVVTKAAIGLFEKMEPICDPENKAILAEWLADIFNGRDSFARTPLMLDIDALREYEPPTPPMMGGGDGPEVL